MKKRDRTLTHSEIATVGLSAISNGTAPSDWNKVELALVNGTQTTLDIHSSAERGDVQITWTTGYALGHQLHALCVHDADIDKVLDVFMQHPRGAAKVARALTKFVKAAET